LHKIRGKVVLRLTPDNEKHWNVWLCWALVEVDRPDDNHAERDHDGDGAGDRAADGAQQQDEHLEKQILIFGGKMSNGVAPLAMPRRWRTVLKKTQAEKIP
jgi:hypothetical protein